MRRWTILIIEDHQPTASALQQLLRMSHHTALTAHSISAAAALIENQSFDLIVSDVHLPDGDGMELMRDITQRKPVRAIALTGAAQLAEDVWRSAGFCDCLQKPIDYPGLTRSIERVMADDNCFGKTNPDMSTP